jgi:hypothetical protein
MQIKLRSHWPQVLVQYFKYYCFADYGSFLFKNRTTRLAYFLPFLLGAIELLTPYNTFVFVFQMAIMISTVLIVFQKLIDWLATANHYQSHTLFISSEYKQKQRASYYAELEEFSSYSSSHNHCIKEVEYTYNFTTYRIGWHFEDGACTKLYLITVYGCFPPYSIVNEKDIYEMALEKHRAMNLKIKKQQEKVKETIKIRKSIEKNGLLKSLIQTDDHLNQAGQLSLVEQVENDS